MWKTTNRTSLLCAAAVMALTATTTTAQTAAQYPSKAVRIILPFLPGGAATSTARIFADKLSKNMGQTFILDNRPGGDTAIGTEAVARSAPDGYTLLVTNTALVIAQSLTPNLRYDTLKDLVGVATLSRSERVLAVHPSVPANNLKELIAYAKQNPGKINVCCQGTSNHLEDVLFMQATGTKLTVAPYTGGGSADEDLMAGIKLQMVFNTSSRFAPHIKAGKLRGIAFTGDRRDPALPDVPTFAEAGLSFPSANWYMLLAPAGTPRDIVEKLNAQTGTAQASKDVQELLAQQGADPFPNNVATTNALLRAQLENFSKAVK